MVKLNFILKTAALAAVFLFVSGVSHAADSALTVEQRLSHLEQLAQTRNKLQADQTYQLSELQREVRELRGILEEHEFKLKQIQDRQRDLYRELENRLSGGRSAASTSSSSSQRATTTGGRNNATTTTSGGSGNENSTTGANPRTAFESAFALVRGKKYAEAVTAFQQFLKKYPQGQFSDNAKFWIGQVYYAQGKTDEAIAEFKQMLTDFPDSAKTASAMIKLGDIYARLQRWDEARDMYQQVVDKYSGTQQQLARKGLDKLKAAGH